MAAGGAGTPASNVGDWGSSSVGLGMPGARRYYLNPERLNGHSAMVAHTAIARLIKQAAAKLSD